MFGRKRATDGEVLTDGLNLAGLRIIERLTSGTPANVCCSPLSLATACAMVRAGAAGATRRELTEVLGWSSLDDRAIDAEIVQLNGLLSSSGLVRVTSANALWHRTHLVVSEAYRAAMREVYGARVAPITTAAAIDAWVADATRGLITNITQGLLLDDTLLLLVNALYFKGGWRTPFDAERSEPAAFYLDDGSVEDCMMMRGYRETLNYACHRGLEIVELSYADHAHSMLLLLPTRGGMPALLASLAAPGRWRDLAASLEERKVDLAMPRIRLEASLLLAGELRALGVMHAFGNDANFSLISDDPLVVTEVVQKVIVDIGEVGTEAAAVTAIAAQRGGVSSSPPVSVLLDRPYLFAIHHRSSGAILFAGVIQRPG